MIRKNKLPELLAPAGDFECLLAAVEGGADAVYVGGKSFGARAFAKNFTDEELRLAVIYCHLHGVKLYVTVNTLLDNRELVEAVMYAERLYSMGVDALIVADVGLIDALRHALPRMELHASTQLSVHNTEGAEAAARLGCSRVVLARETSGADIKRITELCSVETEVFVHGALCVCHSGQCLFSSLVGGRSGNRGECAQPCRLPYNGRHPLSLSDLSLAGHIPELIRSGTASLKIEGRMKSPDYVYTVTSIYRRLLDEGRVANASENEQLKAAFSRSGFTDGYFTGRLGQSMTGVRSKEDKQASKESAGRSFAPARVALRAVCSIKRDEPARLTLELKEGGLAATAEGDIPTEALTSPLDIPSVADRLAKLGATYFSLDKSDISIELDEGLNLSPARLNDLRRRCAEKLCEVCAPERCDSMLGASMLLRELLSGNAQHDRGCDIGRSAVFYRPEVLNAMKREELSGFSAVAVPLFKLGETTYPVSAVLMPPVVMEGEWGRVRAMLADARSRGVEYCIISNIGQIQTAMEYGFMLIGDTRLNVTNLQARRAYRGLGIELMTLSAELEQTDMREVGGRAVVYGRIPLMITERCFTKDVFGCGGCDRSALTDRRGEKFPMMREFDHRCLILNSHVTYMGDKVHLLSGFGVWGEHYIFTTETAPEVRAVLKAFDKGSPMPLSYPFRRMGRRKG